MNRISILLIALLALVVAACSSDQSDPSPSPSQPAASLATTPQPSPSGEPSDAPEASGSALAIPSFDMNADPDLAGRFPDNVGGAPLQVLSFRGETMMASGAVDPAFQEFLDATGAELADVSVAFGGSATGEGGALSVAAFRVMGVPEERLEEEFLASSQASGELSGLDEQEIGGKDVWTAENPTDEAAGMAFIYVQDDTVYFLTGTQEQATEILSALP